MNKLVAVTMLINVFTSFSKTIFSTYPDGELDISVVGTEIFKLNEPLAPIKDKLYDGAVVYIFNE